MYVRCLTVDFSGICCFDLKSLQFNANRRYIVERIGKKNTDLKKIEIHR